MAQAPREVYPHGHHPSVLRSHRWRTAENSAGYLLPLLRPTDRLLDIGVGPGTITVDLATRVPAGTVVGIDNAPAALEAARTLTTARNVTNLTLQPGDAYALDFDADSFDVVHAHQVLQHLADPVAALREMRRVCRPGGVVAARDADYAAMTWYPDHPALTRWLALYRPLARAGGGEPDAGRRLRAWALAAGFQPGHRVCVGVVLQHRRGPGLVVRLLGGTAAFLRPRHPDGRRRAGRQAGTCASCRRLAGMGGAHPAPGSPSSMEKSWLDIERLHSGNLGIVRWGVSSLVN